MYLCIYVYIRTWFNSILAHVLFGIRKSSPGGDAASKGCFKGLCEYVDSVKKGEGSDRGPPSSEHSLFIHKALSSFVKRPGAVCCSSWSHTHICSTRGVYCSQRLLVHLLLLLLLL